MLFSLYLALLLSSFIWPNNYITIINALFGLSALILLSIRIRREDAVIYIYIVFIVASFIVSSLVVGRVGWRLYSPVFFIVYSSGIAMILLRGYIYSWGGYIVFYGLVGYFLMLMLTGVDPTEVLIFSTNGISMMLLVACIPLYITLSIENKIIDLKPAFFTLVFSIWGLGRSGIISSLVLLFGLLLIKLRAKPKYILIVIISFFIAYLFYALSMSSIMHSIFENALNHYVARQMQEGTSPRWTFWTNYFNNLDIFRLIFGVNVVQDPWPDGEINEYNYHNSFIHLHLQTGFMGLITLVLIIFSLFKFYRINQVFLFLLLALILRSSTDSFIFFGRFDFIPFFFIFYFLKRTHIRDLYINRLSAGKNKHSSLQGLP
jgi:hypothetical protein